MITDIISCTSALVVKRIRRVHEIIELDPIPRYRVVSKNEHSDV